jgi:hypothetical protein
MKTTEGMNSYLIISTCIYSGGCLMKDYRNMEGTPTDNETAGESNFSPCRQIPVQTDT